MVWEGLGRVAAPALLAGSKTGLARLPLEGDHWPLIGRLIEAIRDPATQSGLRARLDEVAVAIIAMRVLVAETSQPNLVGYGLLLGVLPDFCELK